jgi:uracil DNA glycosylase
MKYWKKFTSGVLSAINRDRPDVICLLWGKQAQEYKPLLSNCTVLEYSHPASAIYNGTDWNCPHFDEVNGILTNANGEEFQILW